MTCVPRDSASSEQHGATKRDKRAFATNPWLTVSVTSSSSSSGRSSGLAWNAVTKAIACESHEQPLQQS